jgi:hypothetical protein
VFDIQGWITLLLGGLLALITLFTSYSHVHLPFLAALVPALVGLDEVFSEGVAELATRCRLRAECNLVQLRHQLEPSEPDAQRVRDVISLLVEYGGFA